MAAPTLREQIAEIILRKWRQPVAALADALLALVAPLVERAERAEGENALLRRTPADGTIEGASSRYERLRSGLVVAYEQRDALSAEVAALRADRDALREKYEGRRFPVLTTGQSHDANVPTSVPWEWIARFARQAEANHGQTLERLAERSGLGADEMWLVAHGKPPFGPEAKALTQEHAASWLNSRPWEADEIATLRTALAAAQGEHKRLRRFVDVTVRDWLIEDDNHLDCDSSCAYRAAHQEKFEALAAALAPPVPQPDGPTGDASP